ncbi:MAG: hypothetical protein OEX12_00005 [Gammaproteobacteria bacterium]|nr:hypothetical protein [Gammaproteobacteria bacterium]
MEKLDHLIRWVASGGKMAGHDSQGHCVPDYSCCLEMIETPPEERRLFLDAVINDKEALVVSMTLKYCLQAINLSTLICNDKRVFGDDLVELSQAARSVEDQIAISVPPLFS